MKTEKTKRRVITLIITIALFAILGCNNYYHELMPPNDSRILSFQVEGQIGDAEITDDTVIAYVDTTCTVESLVPVIKIPNKATIFPITYEYIEAAFPGVDILKEAAVIYRNEVDLTEYVIDLIKNTEGFNIPVLDKPINFSGPVNFVVLSGAGNISRYVVRVETDPGMPRLVGLSFSKYDNPELIRDALTSIEENKKTVLAEVLYPIELVLSYELIPSFQISGDRLEVDGNVIRSGLDAIQLTRSLGKQIKTITVWRDGMSVDYELTFSVTVDADSNRSITDFRFNKYLNSGIATTAVASIVNNEHLGTIRVQVFYTGAKPSTLTPDYISPGTVSVGGVEQISGLNSHDFSAPVEYRVISRNNQFTRIYTVYVDLIDILSSAPEITSFKFSALVNPELVQDTRAEIAGEMILVEARYGGSYPPELLAPEFSATGLVTVMGAAQTSSFSPQNFLRQVKYTVTNPQNELLTRDYWVQVTFVRDNSSEASIHSFSLQPEDNPGLAETFEGKINQTACTIIINAAPGAGTTASAMIPRFTAAGQVYVNGAAQTSGESGHLFDAPMIYEVVSANGKNRKTYTVTVRELLSTIYVDSRAFGLSDGRSWTDAFRNLKDACEAAALFDEDVPKEIWIAVGTYKPSTIGDRQEYLLLTANTSYIGGFAGNETSKSQRNVAANKVVISGDLGGGQYSNNLFYSPLVNGDLSFEELEFTTARANSGRTGGAGVYTSLTSGSEINIKNSTFNDLQAAGSGGALYISGGKLIMKDNVIKSTTSQSSGAIYGSNLSGTEIERINLQSITGRGLSISGSSGAISINNADLRSVSGYGLYIDNCNSAININNTDFQSVSSYGLYISNCSGDININTANLRNFTNYGIYITGGSGRRELTKITGTRNNSTYEVYVNSGNVVRLGNSNFSGTGVYLSSSGSSITVSDTVINNVAGSYGVSATGGSITMERVNINNVPNGRGLNLSSTGMSIVSNCTITNTSYSSGAGIYINSSGGSRISGCTISYASSTSSGGGIYLSGDSNKEIYGNTRIENVSAGYGGAIYASGSGNLTVSGTTIREARASGSGGAICSYGESGNLTISSSTIQDVSAGYGGGIYLSSNGNNEISGTTIENATASSGSGGGIYAGGSGSLTVSGTTIRNASANDGSGGGIYSWSENLTISSSTIQDVSAGSGGGIYASGSGSLTISNTTIRNASANDGSGGGLYTYSVSRFVINNSSRFEGCTATNMGGAFYAGTSGVSISNTTFLNCIARNHSKIAYVLDGATFTSCTFEHDDNFPRVGLPTVASTDYQSHFPKSTTMTFTRCTFSNLRSNDSGKNYIFNTWSGAWPTSTSAAPRGGGTLRLENNTFNFNNTTRTVALLALFGGQTVNGGIEGNTLYFYSNTINNRDNGRIGCMYNLINLSSVRTTGIPFYFNKSNRYNYIDLVGKENSIIIDADGDITLYNGLGEKHGAFTVNFN